MDSDYAPAVLDDEEQQRRKGDPYPAPVPAFDAASAAPTLPENSPPPVSAPSPDQMEAGAQKSRMMTADQVRTPAPTPAPRPAWKDYAPAERHGLSKLGSALASINPTADRIVNQRPLQNAERDYTAATKEFEGKQADEMAPAKLGQEEAKADQERATAEEKRALAKKAGQPTVGATGEEQTIHDLMTGENGQPRMNPQTGKPYSYLEAFGATKQAAADTKPETGRKTNDITRIVNGVPHVVKVDAATGEDVKDLGQTKIPGESPEQKRTAAESAQVERESRGNIRKAEGEFHNTQKSVGQLTAGIDAAADGNGLLTSFVPTMEVLGINAANGVHRISPAEAQAANLPGGWSEQFNAWFDKAAGGQISPQLKAEGKALAKILLDSSYQRYKSTYDDENGIVSGYGGTGFNKRVPLLQHDQGGGGEQTETRMYQGHSYTKQTDGSWKLQK